MSAEHVTRLYPGPTTDEPLKGLFLDDEIRGNPTAARPFVYTNFISSLDGRISLIDTDTGRRGVPSAIANPHDLRLYMELAAQADVLLSSARHLRARARGMTPDMLSLDDTHWGDLRRWRSDRGLPSQPSIAAISSSLNLPPRDALGPVSDPILVLVCGEVNETRVHALESEGYEIVTCGPGPDVDGAELCRVLASRGHRYVYSIAGPRILTALLRAHKLDRLYLTLVHRLLGGDAFDTLTRGSPFEPPSGFTLRRLYYDACEPKGTGQLFGVFDSAHEDSTKSEAR